MDHFLGHVHHELAMSLICLAQYAAKLVQVPGVFACAAPRDVLRRFPFEQIRQHGPLLAFVKELIEGNLESASHFLQCLNRGNGMTVLDARDIATEQASTLFDVPLREILFFAECEKAVSDNHWGIIPPRHSQKQVAWLK